MSGSRKRPLADPKQYYAYVWRYREEVIWVGQGKDNRGRPYKSNVTGRPKELVEILRESWASIKAEILPCDSRQRAVDLERRLIAELRPKFNTATQQGGWKGMHSAQGLANMSRANKCKKHPPKFGEKIRLRMLGNQNLVGHKHSEETRAKLSAAGKGRKPSDLTRAKSSERAKLRNRLNPPRKGKKVSEEHRRKLREAALRRYARNKELANAS